ACSTQPDGPLEVIDPNASIPFADFGGVRSFQTREDGSLLLEGAAGRWYRATFLRSCPALRSAGMTIGVQSDPSGHVDRFSGVVVDGRYCPFRTLEEVIDPNSRATAAPSAAVESAAPLPPPAKK
ncbi:MAG: hypothetical protein AB7M12_08245, partial [Hyphomonadaceae bacterium]